MRSILALDDDPTVLELVRTVLEDAGYASIGAAHLDDVPSTARADLVISDLLPLKAYDRQVALGWIARLRERFGPVPILVLTAHTAALHEPDGLGVDGVLGKPFDVEALLVKVTELMGAGGQRHPTVTSCRRRSGRPRWGRAALR